MNLLALQATAQNIFVRVNKAFANPVHIPGSPILYNVKFARVQFAGVQFVSSRITTPTHHHARRPRLSTIAARKRVNSIFLKYIAGGFGKR